MMVLSRPFFVHSAKVSLMKTHILNLNKQAILVSLNLFLKILTTAVTYLAIRMRVVISKLHSFDVL